MANRKSLDSNTIDPLQEPEWINTDGIDHERGRIEAEPVVVDKERLAQLAFMNEDVVINIHDSAESRAEPMVQVGCNAQTCLWIMRGVSTKVKRSVAEVLARAKEMKIQQEMYIAPGTGQVVRREIPRSVLKYPFTLEHDPSGSKGVAWLKSIIAQP